MIVVLVIVAGVVLELGLLSFAYREGRIAGARPWQHPGKARELKRGFQPIVEPGTEPPTTAPPKPVRPSPMQPEKW